MIRDNFLKQENYVKCLYPDSKLCFIFVIVNVLCLVLQGKKIKNREKMKNEKCTNT